MVVGVCCVRPEDVELPDGLRECVGEEGRGMLRIGARILRATFWRTVDFFACGCIIKDSSGTTFRGCMAVIVTMESRLRIEYVWIAAVEVGTEENGGERRRERGESEVRFEV